MNEYKIESGIPLSSERRGRGHHWKDLAANMMEGDSVLLPNDKKAQNLRVAITRAGHFAAQRKTSEGVRVWKVANKYVRGIK